MPQIPYSPVPDVQPEDRVAQPPRIQVYTNPDMFGANVGRAVEQLGGTIGKVGDEMFQRALAIQQIKNQAELDNLNSQFLTETAGIHANFSAQQGKNAVDGLPQYGTDLNAVRDRIQSQASNPTVARLFESTTRSQVARDLFNGAGHAGQQLKVYQNDTIKQGLDANAHSAGLSPFDDDGFQKRVDTQVALAKDGAALLGLDPDDAAAKEVSRLWKERLTAMGRRDPFQATKLLRDNADKIRSDDYAKLDNYLDTQSHTIGARNISSNLLNGRDISLGNKIVPMDAAKRAIASIESGGSDHEYTLRGPMTKLGHALGKYQVMEAELPSQLKEAGLPPMTPDEFRNNPQAQEQLFSTVFGNLMTKYGSFNEAASRWFSGRSVDDATAKNVKDAFGTNVPAYLAKTNATLARELPLSRVIDAGSATADNVSDNPQLKDYVTHYITQDRNRDAAVRRDAINQDRNILESAFGGDFTGGQFPKDFDTFINLPQVQQVIAGGRLDRKEINNLPALFERRQKALTAESNQRVKNTLNGMADDDPLTFSAIKDFSEFGLSAKDIGYFEKLQRQKRASAEGDPDLRKAYQAVRPMLPLNFDSNAKDMAATRQEFKGALREGVIAKMQEKGGKKLTDEEYREIGKDLLKQQLNTGFWSYVPTWLGGEPTVPWYRSVRTVPDAAKEAIKQDYLEQGLSEPTEEQYIQEYSRERFRKDFGKAKD